MPGLPEPGECRGNQLKSNREIRDKLPADKDRAGVAGAEQRAAKESLAKVSLEATAGPEQLMRGSRRNLICAKPFTGSQGTTRKTPESIRMEYTRGDT